MSIDRVRSRTGLAHPRPRGAGAPPGGKAHRVPFRCPEAGLYLIHAESAILKLLGNKRMARVVKPIPFCGFTPLYCILTVNSCGDPRINSD